MKLSLLIEFLTLGKYPFKNTEVKNQWQLFVLHCEERHLDLCGVYLEENLFICTLQNLNPQQYKYLPGSV